jgi:hypothetical protein
MFRTLVSLAAITSVIACPEHNFNIRARDDLGRRATAGAHDWDYKDPSSWGSIKAGKSPNLSQHEQVPNILQNMQFAQVALCNRQSTLPLGPSHLHMPRLSLTRKRSRDS